MGSTMQNLLFALLIIGGSITAFVLLLVFVVVPLFKGIGAGITLVFRGIGWFFRHVFEFIIGTCSDVIRFIGALIAMVVLLPMVPLNIIIGRWSAAGHFSDGVKREGQVAAACVYRAAIRRPLKLLLLDGLLEGLEQRVPEAMHGAPGSDAPSRRSGGVHQFDGYTIVGSLRAGGSGAKLYVAEPSREKHAKIRNLPNRVVIKSFALTEGSSLPQIVRESRALECAKQLGHVLDHGMDDHRFFYVMPYHPGEHLGILTRQLHGECGGRGLDQKHLALVMSYTHDLLATLSAYHKGGLWHKDVKPENVIVHDGAAHLVDLGLVTPLRSAMTLTTHGTEYFRDPEMVRQALRGVKVHQVNGAKFDIYAAGAVLYFMIENTFPAHGGLSRFVIKSPEALRWIVRRAMTEYHQRYSSADEMLADLDYVAAAHDAFAVKPAELPSMRNEEPVEIEASAGSPDVAAGATFSANAPSTGQDNQRHASTVIGAKVGKDGGHAGIKFGRIGVGNGAHQPASSAGSTSKPRPKLTVTNWWTGEYAVDDAADAASSPQTDASFSSEAKQFRAQEASFRQKAEEIQRQARVGFISARRAAREQIRLARQRARDMRRRARMHRERIAPRPHTRTSALVIGALSVLFLGAILWMSFMRTTITSRRTNLPLVLAVDSAAPLPDTVRNQIKRIVADYRAEGYDVIEEPAEVVTPVLPAIRQWADDGDDAATDTIENFLENESAYGLLHINVQKSRRGKLMVESPTLVWSNRPGAELRRRIAPVEIPAPPQHALPYLVINDHPAKADLSVAAEIERRLKAYRDRGWALVTNDDVEVKVRNVLPFGPLDPALPVSPVLHATLAEANLGGILRIEGKAGNEPVPQRVTLTRIDRDMSIPALPGKP